MKQSTFSAVMANSIKNLLQGYTKGIRFVAVLMVLLTMGIGQAWGATIFNCGIEVNETWYKGTGTINSGNWLGAQSAFNNKDFGVITSLKLGGQYDTWDNNQTDACGWNLNNGIWITITTSSGTQKDNFKLSCYHSGRDGNNNIWKTTGKTGSCGDGTSFGRYTYDISSYAAGKYKMKASWTSPSSQATQATASFTIPGFTTTSASQGFDNTTVSSNSSKTISFGQHYGTALNANNCVISGTNKSEFSVTSITETNVTVKFAPTSAGNKSATLTITDAHGKVCTVALSGKTQYVVTYSKGNYGDGSNKTVYKVYGTNLTLADKGNFTRENYTQTAWNTNADGTSGTSYALKANYTKEAAITLYPTWTGNPQTVTWEVNGETYTAGSPTTSVAYNSKVTTLPTAPSIDCNGKVFVGWSNEEVTNGLEPSVLFTSASNAPAVTEATTYHAVFADQEGFDGNVDFSAQGWTNGTDLPLSTPLIFNNSIYIKFAQNGGADFPEYYDHGEAIRLYCNNSMTISLTSGEKIQSITMYFSSETDKGNSITANTGGTLPNGTEVTDYTWTMNASSVTFTIGVNKDGNATGHRKISGLLVETDGGTVSYSNYTTSCIPIYTITYDLNGGSGGCAEAEVEKGSNYTICATTPTKDGYIFQGWEYNGTTYKEGATISNIQSDITLVAQWNPITYSVVFDANGGLGTMERQTFTYDDAQSLTANTFTRDNYEFAGWNTATNGSGKSYDDEEEVKNLTTENGATITLYAQWQKLYTVTFYNIGSLLETKTQEAVGGSIACPTITAPCDGYEFVGWSETAVTNGATSYTDVSCPITPTEDTKLYAVYSQGDGGGGTTAISIKTYQDGTYYLIDSFTDANSKTTYHSPKGTKAGKLSSVDLTNVVTIEDGILTLDITSNSLTEDMKYTISKENDTYKIYNAETEAYVEPSASGTNFKNTSASGWSIDDENNRFMFYYNTRAFLYQDSYNSNGTKIYGRQFGNYASSVAGTITNQSGKECYGSGYFFLVPATGGSTTTYTTTPDCCTPLAEITGMTFSAMTRSITVSVPDSYDNTNVDGYIFNLYNAATGGVATTYDTNDKNEKSHTFTGLNPNTAYHFTIIAKGSGAYCNSEETSPRESYTTLPQYTVTWDPAGGHWSGNYNNKVDTYDYQAAITKPDDPKRTGYTFNGWDKTLATNMPAENLTYTAQWNIETYTITYENLNGASNSNPISYDVESETITLQDPGNRDDFAFGGWYSDAECTTEVTEIPKGSTGDITLYAKWIAIYSVTWMVNGSEYTEGNPDTEVLDGDKVESLPTPPTPDEGNDIYCGEVFAGWTDKPIDGQTDTYPDPLFTTIEGSPEIKQNTTFYAVFADYKEQ